MNESGMSVTDLEFMLKGAWITLQLTFWAMLIGTLFGTLFGVFRTAFARISWPLAWVLDAFRSVPLLIQFVVFNALKSIAGLPWSAFEVASVVLGIYTAALCTEIVRSGLQSVPVGVRKASRSLGMSRLQTFAYITLPMAVRIGFPSWINVCLSVMKDTALVMWVGVFELLRASQSVITRIQEPLLVLCVTGLIYYLMSLVIARAGALVERRWQNND